MIPILYDKTGNTKITNLTDCIQCIVTEERNGMFEAELVYSVHSSNSDKLIRGNIIVADANDTLKGQKFRIYKISKPINGRIKILARHISFDMARDVVTGLVIDNQSCEYALNKLFSSSQFSQHFTGHSDIVNSQSTVINGTTHLLKAIVGVEGSIIDTFGTSPEILRDNYDFYIYENRGHDNGVTIEYGKNLTGLNLDTDDSNMITRIRAIAKYRDENQEEVVVVSSPEFVDSPYINNYETPFIQEIDFSNHFKDDDIPTPIRLKTLAENYFANNKCDLPSENATISFIPLSKCVGYEGIQDKISLCDTVTVIDYRYNLTTKVKVIKVSYNTLKERYENMEVGEPRSRLGDIISNSMNSVKGEKGDKGDKGDKGEDGSIGDFPDSLPTTPILSSSLYGFASIELSWTFESQPYYTYELYASRTENFIPNEFDLLFEGKGSTFLFQAKPNETWYFRTRCVNTHGNATEFSNQVTVITTKVDNLSNYVDNAAIGEALIGTLSLDRGWVGTLKGNYIDAKQLSVTDGNDKRTLFIDSNGNVYLDVTELKISNKQVATTEEVGNTILQATNNLVTNEELLQEVESGNDIVKVEMIKQIYKSLQTEYLNNLEQAETAYSNSYLDEEPKNNLEAAITDYKAKFLEVTNAYNLIDYNNQLQGSETTAWNDAIADYQTSIENLGKRLQEAQTYINTAVYNASVNYTNETIPDRLTGYAKTSYVDEAMEQAVLDAKDGMVSNTQLTINNNSILMSAASMGQYNLLRNSDFRKGFEYWNTTGLNTTHLSSIVNSNTDHAMHNENNAMIYSNSATVGSLSNISLYQDVVLLPNTTYTLSYWVNTVSATTRMEVGNYNSSSTYSVSGYKTYANISGGSDRESWKFDSITFTTPSDTTKVRIKYMVTNCTATYYRAFLVKPMLCLGDIAQAWSGHPDEIYVGVVSITEEKGLMVEHSNVNTRSVMSADGFCIEDENGEAIAWLSSKEQWSELKADKVFASNIENIYTGDANLYVDHSATIAGDGTSSKPFNSFAQLSNHLMANPIINKDIYIVVKNPGFIIHEQLYLERLKGTGFIKITLEGNLVMANPGNGQYCIRLHQIPKWVWIVSGREFGSSTTGAVLCDGSSEGGGGHGIYCTDVERIEVDALTIACKNWGILSERCYVYTHHVDFGKCYNAIELRYQSIYYSSNDVGSCTDFCRLQSGSFAYWGCGTVRPQGNVQWSDGMHYDGGVSLTPTASPRYADANPTPPSTSGQYFTKTYDCISKQSYQYSWSNWSTDGSCKQGAWGNLSPYVKKLA